jgi:probable HAF family extracellular repeat protein
MWAIFNLYVTNVPDGKHLVSVAHTNLGLPVGLPGPGSVPAPGDVVSLWGGPAAQPYGHTAVVTAVKVDPLGNGTISIMEQNALASGADQINVSHWKETYGVKDYAGGYYYYDHITWLKLVPDGPPASFVYAVRSLGAAAVDAGSINATGQVSGRSPAQSTHGMRAHLVFMYSRGKMSFLHAPMRTADPTGRATINDFGAIAVTTATGSDRSAGYAIGTRNGIHWHMLPAGPSYSRAVTLGINNRGDISGWIAKQGSRSPSAGVVWVHTAGSYSARILSANRSFASPEVYASDTTGDAVGTESLGKSKFALLWAQSGKGFRLPDLTTPPQSGAAVAMQAHGSSGARLLSVAGASRDVNGVQQACEWTIKIVGGQITVSAPQVLAQLTAYRSSQATAINAAGWVIGTAVTTTGQATAFLWRPGIGPVDVNSLLKPTSGWRVVKASAINAAGQIVAQGYYRSSSQSRNVLLNPVPPDSSPKG